MKKVYITALHLMHGGIEMAITSVGNALVKRGYDVEILCTYNLGAPSYPLDSRVKVTYLTDVKPNKDAIRDAIASKNVKGIVREGLYAAKVLYLKKKVLKDQFRKIKAGVIISTRNEDSVLLSRYGNSNVLKIAQLHHDHCFDKKLLRDFAHNYSNIDVFTLLTDQLKEEVSEIMKNNHHTKCVTMPNFLPDSDLITENVLRANQAIAVGRLHPVKGFLRLIRLWKSVYEQTGTVLKIVGGGEQREELEKEIAAQGLESGVILTGAMDHDNVLEEMRKSILYVMTSATEGFPFVLIEAMSQGLPVIAYDVRVGPRAIIEEGKNGYLIADDDAESFVNKIVSLITDDNKREKMSHMAFERSEVFTENEVLAMWMKLLQ